MKKLLQMLSTSWKQKYRALEAEYASLQQRSADAIERARSAENQLTGARSRIRELDQFQTPRYQRRIIPLTSKHQNSCYRFFSSEAGQQLLQNLTVYWRQEMFEAMHRSENTTWYAGHAAGGYQNLYNLSQSVKVTLPSAYTDDHTELSEAGKQDKQQVKTPAETPVGAEALRENLRP